MKKSDIVYDDEGFEWVVETGEILTKKNGKRYIEVRRGIFVAAFDIIDKKSPAIKTDRA